MNNSNAQKKIIVVIDKFFYNGKIYLNSNIKNTLEIYLVMGTNVRNDPSVKKLAVSQLIPHPGYRDDLYEYHIALIQTTDLIEFSYYTRPICLPNYKMNFKLLPFRYCVLNGMGNISE